MQPMDSRSNAHRLRSVVAATALLAVSGTASAAAVSKTLQYSCPFPIIGTQTITAEINANMPDTVTAGDTFGPFDINATTTVPGVAVQGLQVASAVTLEGSATNVSTVTTPGGSQDLSVNLTIPQTDVPSTPQDFPVPASGTTPQVTFDSSDVGQGQVTIGALTLNMTARQADGSIAPAPVGQFTSDCTQVSGQDNVLHTFTVQPQTTPASISVSPTSVDFGDQQLGVTSSSQAITVSNTGGEDLGINGVSISGANAGAFAQTNNCSTVANGESCTVNVSFTPSTQGGKDATLTIDSTDHSVDVSLTGNGVPEQVAGISVSPSSVDFGDVQVGTNSAPQAVTVNSTGTIGLNVSNVSISGTNAGAFSQTNNCSTVASGGSCSVQVTLMPNSTGSQSATLSISSNADSQSTVDVPLSGNGTAVPEPNIAVSPQSVSFGSVNVGETQSQDVTVGNDGDAALTVSSVTLGGANADQFTQSNDCTTVDAGSSCTVTVTFTPSGESSASASLTIGSNDPDGDVTVDVSGQGQANNGGGGGGTEIAFDIDGSTHVKAANSDLALSGAIDATLDLSTGDFMADLSLDPTSGTVNVGPLQAKVNATFEQAEQTTGRYDNGTLTADSSVYINVPRVTAKILFFRIPVAGGPHCRTSEPVDISLQSQGDFQPLGGGDVAGTYTLPPLKHCGPLTGLLNQLFAGPDNTINLNLSSQDGSSSSSSSSSGSQSSDSGDDGHHRWWRH